jgi:GNAT superfamily N-acetyltransferase
VALPGRAWTAVEADLRAGRGEVAELEGRRVAAARVLLLHDHLHVRHVAVRPGFRRWGVATRVMQWLHGQAASLGYAVCQPRRSQGPAPLTGPCTTSSGTTNQAITAFGPSCALTSPRDNSVPTSSNRQNVTRRAAGGY